eukprot:scaffold66978_cov72-Phaeocystis_antarctica.AAC.3
MVAVVQLGFLFVGTGLEHVGLALNSGEDAVCALAIVGHGLARRAERSRRAARSCGRSGCALLSATSRRAPCW